MSVNKNPETRAISRKPEVEAIRISLIDGDRRLLVPLSHALEQNGYKAELHHHVEEVLHYLSQIDLLVLDASVAQQPKSSQLIKAPAILVLYQDTESDLPPWLQAQHVSMLSYPQDPQELIDRLDQYLSPYIPHFAVDSYSSEHLALLFGITQFLSRHLDLDDLFERILALAPYLKSQFSALLVKEEDEVIYYRSTQPGREEMTGLAGQRFARRLLKDGLEGWVLQQKKAVIVSNTQHDRRWFHAPYLPDQGHCVAAMPIQLERVKAQGIYLIGHENTGYFSEEDLPLLEAATTQISLAIENAMLFKNQMQRSMQLSLINKVAQAATSILNLEVMLRTVVQAIHRSFACYSVAIHLYNQVENIIKLKARIVSDYPGSTPSEQEENVMTHRPREGLIGWAIATNRTVLANDVSCEPRYIIGEETKEIRSELCVPISLGPKIIGVLDLRSLHLEAFNKYHVGALETLADQLAVAIENARLYDEINLHIQHLKSLNQIGQAITSSLDLHETLTLITDQTTRLMDVAAASVVLRDNASDEVLFAAASGEGSEAAIGWRMPLDRGIAGWVASHGEPVIVPDVHSDKRFFSDVDKHSGFTTRSILCVPLTTKGNTIGALEVMNKKNGTFNEDDLAILQALAAPAATAIENAQLFQHAESLRSFNEDIIENMTNGLVVIDRDQRITVFNPAASKMLGYRRDQVLYQPVDQALDGTDELTAVFDKTILEGPQPRQEIKVQHKSGRDCPISISTALLQGQDNRDEMAGIVGVIEDLSELKALEAERRRLDRLAALGEMSAVVAHEIRNPVAGIAAGVEYLTRNFPKGSTEAEGAALIHGEIKRLNRILEDILFVARPLQLHCTSSDISTIIDSVVQRCQTQASAASAAIHVEIDPVLPAIDVDCQRIEQVLFNLLVNAIQAMPDGGKILITAQQKDDDGIVVSVADTGPGIPQDRLEHIFEPFFTTKAKGTGLGLSIARRIVEAHGGTCHISSQINQGSSFTLMLPTKRGQHGDFQNSYRG